MDPVTSVANDLNTAATGAVQSSADIATVMKQQAGIKTAFADAAGEAEKAAELVSTTENMSVLATQEAQRRIGRLFGADITDTRTDLITPLAERQRDLNGVADQAYAEYAKKSETNFFDSPMAWIANNVFGGTEQARTKYNNVATQVNDVGARIEGIYKETTEGAIAQKQIEQTMTAESVAAKATLAGFAYLQAGAQAKYDSLGVDVGILKELQEGNVAAANLRARRWELLKQDEAFKLQQQQYRIAFEEHKEKVDARNTVAQVYRLGYAAYGFAIPSDTNIDRLVTLSNSPAGKGRLDPIFERGIYALSTMDKNGHYDNSLGVDAGAVVEGVVKVHPQFADDNPLKRPLEVMMTDVYGKLPLAEIKDKSAAGVKFAINTKAKEVSEEFLANAENPSGVYYDKGFKATAQANPTLVNSNFWKTVVQPFAGNNVDHASAQQLLSSGTKLVTDGKLGLEEFSKGMADYYGTVAALNNIAAPKVGFALQDSYKAKAGGFGSGLGNIDFTKPEQIKNAVLTTYNRQVRAEEDQKEAQDRVTRMTGAAVKGVPPGPNPFLRNP